MTTADVHLMQWLYILAALGVVLFSSFLTRWLWRPLRFLVLSAVISVMFTPFYVEQAMPDGSTQNIVPALVVMLHDAANDRDNWQQAIQRGGKAIVTVAGAMGVVSLLLAIVWPRRPRQSQPVPDAEKSRQARNPYMPDDFNNDSRPAH